MAKYQYPLQFKASNLQNQHMNVKFNFENVGFEIINETEWKEGFRFNALEEKTLTFSIQPKQNGLISIILHGIHEIKYEVSEKRNQLRDNIPDDIIKSIFSQRLQLDINQINLENLKNGEIELYGNKPIDGVQAQEMLNQILNPPPVVITPNEFSPDNNENMENLPLPPITAQKEDPNIAIESIIRRVLKNDPILAFQILGNITDSVQKNRLFFEIFPLIIKKNNEIVKKILISLTDVALLRDCLLIIAFVDGIPKLMDNITTLSPDIQNQMNLALKDIIYHDVDFTIQKTRIDPLGDLLITFHAWADPITPEIEHFAKLGGNLSINLLKPEDQKQISSILLFPYMSSISLTSLFDYFEKMNNDASNLISYFIMSNPNGLDKETEEVLQKLGKLFFKKISIENQNLTKVFLIDFLPFLNTNTIIMGSSSSEMKNLIEIYKQKIKSRINIIEDNQMVIEGSEIAVIQKMFSNPKCTIVPLLIPYNIFHDYSLFEYFIKEMK